jgi:hypothetical protein
MRNIYFLICFFLLSGTIGSLSPFFDLTCSGTTTSSSSTYGVELAKFKYPVFTDYFESIPDVVELTDEEGSYHYVSGLTPSKDEAEDLAEKIKSSGYADAKVLNLNEAFSSKQIAHILEREENDQDKNQKQMSSDSELEEKSPAEIAIGEMTDIGNAYFYTILLEESKSSLKADHFSPYHSVKVLREKESFQYVMGRFDDIADAIAQLKNQVQNDFPAARVAVIREGSLAEIPKAQEDKQEVKRASFPVGSYNMGRKMRGKEYVDYYYEFGQTTSVENSAYHIELGVYSNKKQAEEVLQKLQEMGFSQATIKTGSTSPERVTKAELTPDAHFTIQVFTSKKEMNLKRLDLPGLNCTFDQKDDLYRYFYGDFDNYWVCRRGLREIRNKGFVDAFIVKL